MKKILLFFASAAAFLCIVASCDNEPKNPGDFDMKAELKLGDVVSLSGGQTIPLTVYQERDTQFNYYVNWKDTVFDADGGIVQINEHTDTVVSPNVSKFIRFEAIDLPWYIDTFRIQVTSNAQWTANNATASATWFGLTKSTGGGDSYIEFLTNEENEGARRRVPANVNVYTRDSSIMYRIPVYQEGQ